MPNCTQNKPSDEPSCHEVEDDVDAERQANTPDAWSLLREMSGQEMKTLLANLDEASKAINDGTDREYRRYFCPNNP
jgi:hypothetical protein